jgi:3-(3-hydroxy-phenyl)propionate hydroxylase
MPPIQRAGQDAWLLDQLGNRFQLLVFADSAGAVDAATLAQFKSLAGDAIAVEPVVVTPSGGQIDGVTVLADAQAWSARRYDAKPGTAYLVRPDQHVAARWRAFDPPRVRAAVARATCNA